MEMFLKNLFSLRKEKERERRGEGEGKGGGKRGEGRRGEGRKLFLMDEIPYREKIPTSSNIMNTSHRHSNLAVRLSTRASFPLFL